jgi:hypothetical protein
LARFAFDRLLSQNAADMPALTPSRFHSSRALKVLVVALCLTTCALMTTGCLSRALDRPPQAILQIGWTTAPATRPTTQQVPIATVSNAWGRLVLALPDVSPRWYEGQRFDAGTMVLNYHFDGIDVFGPADLSARANPRGHDATARGIAGEFDIESPATYDSANPEGGSFVKIGVGELRRSSTQPYKFYWNYPLISEPERITRSNADGSITFTQRFNSSLGIAYTLDRTYRLLSDTPGFTVTTTFQNTGTRDIDTEHYFHHFITSAGLGNQRGDAVHWTFPTTAPVDLRSPEGVTSVEGNALTFATTMPVGKTVYAAVPIAAPGGAGNEVRVRHNDMTLTITPGIAVSRFAIWCDMTRICPEMFTQLHISPGETTEWTTRYAFKRN